MRHTVTSGSAVLVLALAMTLVGCSGDQEPETEPISGASSTGPVPPTSTGPTSTGPTSTSPTSVPATPVESGPAVEPATGRRVTIGAISMRIPEGWRYNDGGINPFSRGGSGGLGSQYATIGSTPDLSGGSITLDRAVKILIKSAYPERAPKRLADREIDGVLFARIKGPTDDTFEVEHYITTYNGATLEIEFDLVRDDGFAANTAIIEGCLATVEID